MNRSRQKRKLKTDNDTTASVAMTSSGASTAAFTGKRVNTINSVFEVLRQKIPTFPYERRLSKIDTLHLTISYMYLLQSIMDSNLTLFDYLCKIVHELSYSSYERRMMIKPNWATSDLIVRLNWLNWSAIGVEINETGVYLSLFNQIYELTITQ